MRKIYITESQLNSVKKLMETINQTIDKKPGESLDTAIKRAQTEVHADAPNADVNYVIPGDEVNEDGFANVSDQVVDYILTNWYDDLDETTPISEVYAMIMDAYIEVTGNEIDSEEVEEEIFRKLSDRFFDNSKNESFVVTKKQIKEAQKRKRISEAVTVVSKEDLINSLKK